MILDEFYTDNSRYSPGENVAITIRLHNTTDKTQTGFVRVDLRFLMTSIVTESSQELTLEAGEKTTVTLSLMPPMTDFIGYLLVGQFVQEDTVTDEMVNAVDVSSDWSKFPRYGYLVNYSPANELSVDFIMDSLSKYHINGLQFYDWQDTHHIPLRFDTEGNPLQSWTELSNRTVSFATVEAYINAAHERNMMAMNYNLLFGTYDNPQSDGVSLDWGLYQDQNATSIDHHSLPSNWETSRLLLMDPSNTDWQAYIFEQERKTFEALGFDGWHIDQLGDRGARYDINGNYIPMISSYMDFIENAKQDLDVRLLFNAVDGFGQGSFANSEDLDFLYQEVWSDHTYAELKQLIDQGRAWSEYEKGMILAAYMNYGSRDRSGFFNTHSVLLTNATIFASGAAHLELGDSGMLSSEYFPSNNLKMTKELETKLQHYYNFLVAYQNILREDLGNTFYKVEMENVASSTLGASDKVWKFTKENDEYVAIHFINLLGNENDWRDDNRDKEAPTILTDVPVKVYYSESFSNLYFMSPDVNGGLPQAVEYDILSDEDGTYISFVLPSLEYWDMVVIEK
jgi:dextranase